MSKELIERLRAKTIDASYSILDLHNDAADLIEQQQSWIASLEQNARDADRMYAELETELAASQAQIKVLREALEKIVNDNFDSYDEVAELAFAALNKPTDDSALRELLKAERERCAKVCDRKKKEFAEAFKDMADESLGAGQCAAAIRAMEDQ